MTTATQDQDPSLWTPIQNHDVTQLCQVLFGVTLTPSQARIVETIAYNTHKRYTVSAMTRYGKSYSVALGTCLRLLIESNPVTVAIVAPRRDQAQSVRKQIASCIVECEPLRRIVDESTQSIERLRQEVSRNRVTFEGGEKEVVVLTGHGDGEALMGHGCDLLILDESCLLSSEAYSKAIRMLGNNPDHGQIVELGNPFHAGNHFYDHHQDPHWESLVIDWRTAVEEGRTTQAFVEEQRRELSPPEFQVFYEATFPESAEDQLVPWEWVRRSIASDVDAEGRTRYGLDVAEGGVDKAVLTRVVVEDGVYHVTDVWTWSREDTMHTVDRAQSHMEDGAEVCVDTIGVGKGVGDELKRRGFNVRGVKVSRKAKDLDRFANLKAEMFWNLRQLFEAERVVIPDHKSLRRDLSLYRYELKSGRVSVYEEGDKSPDHGDSLALACWGPVGVTMPVYW